MRLGEIIVQYRNERGLNIREFSRQCKISYGYINKLEMGTDYNTGNPNVPTLKTIELLAKGMGMTFGELLMKMDYQIIDLENLSPEDGKVMLDLYGKMRGK